MSISLTNEKAFTACSREPIHIPGAIQPHGVLLAFSEPDLICTQVSENTQPLLGLAPADLLGRSFTDLIRVAPETWKEIMADPFRASPVAGQIGDRAYDLLLHRQDNVLIAEIETLAEGRPQRYHRRLESAFAAMRAAESLPELYQICARFVSEITGYERVMVYRFDADWHGEVVGEHLSAEVDSYFGHHFPASDIPEQARALYTNSWLRIIPNASYTPVPLTPARNPRTSQPLNLSGSVLRSVSPIHLEYLRNMDVAASMSISLLVDGLLWGLIACHHREPRPLSYDTRAACEMLGQIASLEIASKQETRRLAEHVEAKTIQTKFFDVLAQETDVIQALIKYTPDLLQYMGASGAILYVNDTITQLGTTPERTVLERLISWLQQQPVNPIYQTDSLSRHWPEASSCQDLASGLLAVKLSRVDHHYILWLRPEQPTTVTWAGNPTKPVEESQALHPRKSFAAWTEDVRGRARPWSETEIQGARELLNAVNSLVLRRSEHLLNLNSELEKKNSDLNSFAYIASHDLREPIRGIANYSSFVLEDFSSQLPEEALQKLEKINSLARRSEILLESLTYFSKLGRIEITRRSCDLNEVLDEVLENLETTIAEQNVEIRRPSSLPTFDCDVVLVREIFSNLISNAIRYNTSPQKWVEVGVQTDPDSGFVFYVRDNGIGIRDKHHNAIFHMFRRLHAMGEFGVGTGAGLAIVRSIVERHKGRIWVESEFGQGSTFYFTLA